MPELTFGVGSSEVPMPFLFFILLVILIAQIGFWKTLGAIIGAAAMLVLLVVAGRSPCWSWRHC